MQASVSLLFIIFKSVPIFQYKAQGYSYSLDTVLDAANPALWQLFHKAINCFIKSSLSWLIYWQRFKAVIYHLHDSLCDPPPTLLVFPSSEHLLPLSQKCKVEMQLKDFNSRHPNKRESQMNLSPSPEPILKTESMDPLRDTFSQHPERSCKGMFLHPKRTGRHHGYNLLYDSMTSFHKPQIMKVFVKCTLHTTIWWLFSEKSSWSTQIIVKLTFN